MSKPNLSIAELISQIVRAEERDAFEGLIRDHLCSIAHIGMRTSGAPLAPSADRDHLERQLKAARFRFAKYGFRHCGCRSLSAR